LTEHNDVMKSLLRGAPRPGVALGPASARAGPVSVCDKIMVHPVNKSYIIAWKIMQKLQHIYE